MKKIGKVSSYDKVKITIDSDSMRKAFEEAGKEYKPVEYILENVEIHADFGVIRKYDSGGNLFEMKGNGRSKVEIRGWNGMTRFEDNIDSELGPVLPSMGE